MIIFVRGASPNQLSAESCKTVVLDECDKYELYRENKAEADLRALAYERTKFYKNHLKVDTSTPTIPAGSIWQLYHENPARGRANIAAQFLRLIPDECIQSNGGSIRHLSDQELVNAWEFARKSLATANTHGDDRNQAFVQRSNNETEIRNP